MNQRDSQRLTPLHYASQGWPQPAVRALLELGGNVGMRDLYDVTPITFIPPDTMEAFLDDYCLQVKTLFTIFFSRTIIILYL